MPLFSSPEEVCVVFRSILDDAQFSPERFSIHNLKQCSFSYGVLEGNVAKISGYLHASEKITEAAVRTWIFDNRIHGEIKWTAVMPGKYGDWKKHPTGRSCRHCRLYARFHKLHRPFAPSDPSLSLHPY
jgi:hypothetical protein